MDFFYANPSGRIMNRFAKDMKIVDTTLTEDTSETINTAMVIIGILILNVITMWFSVVIVIPLIIVVVIVRQYYVRFEKLGKTPKNVKPNVWIILLT